MASLPPGAGSLVGQHLGKYELLAFLALGGTAEIYLARIGGTAGFEKYVVVKCLHDHLADDAEFVRMFLDEARLGALLQHSNIVQTLELGEWNGRYFMAMEFLAGLSLSSVIRRLVGRVPGGRLPVHLALGIIAQTCTGLHYAHTRTSGGTALSVVHRDISPQNLVVTFEGVVKIVDFGIAKTELRDTRTKSGTIKGKFAYMSPEQCLAAPDVDRRTDVFALGVVTHELVTGRRLFKKATPYETYHGILECRVPAPSSVNHELDPGIDEVILKALAKEREHRYPTAEAFGEAVIGYLHRRGKQSGAGELSRFLEQYFRPELDEHHARMRELIDGDVGATTTMISWDGDGSDAAGKMPDDLEESFSEGSAIGLSTDDLEASGDVLSSAGVGPSAVRIGEIGHGGDEDEEDPGAATRIELNPLEHVENADTREGFTEPPTSPRFTTADTGPGNPALRQATRPPPAAAPPKTTASLRPRQTIQSAMPEIPKARAASAPPRAASVPPPQAGPAAAPPRSPAAEAKTQLAMEAPRLAFGGTLDLRTAVDPNAPRPLGPVTPGSLPLAPPPGTDPGYAAFPPYGEFSDLQVTDRLPRQPKSWFLPAVFVATMTVTALIIILVARLLR